MTEAELEEKKPRKPRNVEPRHPLHQACLDAMHEWIKYPFTDQRNAVTDAMLAYKRHKYGDPELKSL